MRRTLLSPPDDFSTSPLLSLLPVRGKVGRLSALTSSLFARLEKVNTALNDGTQSAEEKRRSQSEEAMLKQVLEWLELKPAT